LPDNIYVLYKHALSRLEAAQLPNYYLAACSGYTHTENGYFVNKGKGKGKRGLALRLVVTHLCAQVWQAYSMNLSFTCTPRVPLTE